MNDINSLHKNYPLIIYFFVSAILGIISSLILTNKNILNLSLFILFFIVISIVLFKLFFTKSNITFSLFFIFGFFFLTIRGIVITSLGLSETLEPIISVLWQELFLLIMLFSLLLKHRNIKLKLMDIFLLAYLINGLLLAFFDIPNSIYGVRITFYPVFFYFLTKILLNEQNEIRKIHNLILKLMFLFCFLGYLLYFGISEEEYFSIVYKYNFITQAQGYLYYENVLRMTSLLWNPLSFAALMILASNFSFCLYNIQKKKIHLFFFIATSICILFSMVRAAWIGWILGIFIISLILNKSFKMIFIFTLSITIVFFILNKLNYINNITDHLIAILPWATKDYGVNDAYSLRLEQWWYGMKQFVLYPFGKGTGTVGGATHLRIQNENLIGNREIISDGYYFKLLVENGIQGLLFFTIFLISFLIKCLKKLLSNMKKDNNYIILLGTFTSLIAFILQGFVANNWDFVLIPYIYFFYIAASMNILDRK